MHKSGEVIGENTPNITFVKKVGWIGVLIRTAEFFLELLYYKFTIIFKVILNIGLV